MVLTNRNMREENIHTIHETHIHSMLNENVDLIEKRKQTTSVPLVYYASHTP